MNLTPGRRLTVGERTAYVLGELAWSTPRHTWMRAHKVFWNFRYPGEPLYEAEADEWLDVLVRASNRPGAVSDFERASVLARADVPWFLELMDVLDHPDPAEDGPLLVLADPHAIQVVSEPIDASRLVRMMTEVLAMLNHLHREGMAASALEPEDFLIDPTGRWFFLGTDRIEPANARDPSAFSNDLTAWAQCAERLLGVTDRGSIETAWPFLATLSEPARPAARWLFDRVRRCIDPDPARRPTSLDDLGRGRTAGSVALTSLGSFFSRRPSRSQGTGRQ